ncbi:MAG: hypothetical protein MI684_05455 [Chlorobiales bacterium]|nr:hypothetical protein [Chlorobiales bacterium]
MQIKDDVIHWLLEDENPPVRYLTLTKLLNHPETASEVRQTRARFMEYNVTQGILRHSKEFWKNDDRAYWKYTGKYWQLIFLGQFMADGKDPRIAEGTHDILKKRKWVMKSGGQCLTANLLTAFRRLGYGGHTVVIEETEALANRIVTDRGIKCTAMDCSLLPRCYMAVPKILLLFAEIPAQKRSVNVNLAIELLVEKLLENEVYVYVPSARKEWRKILDKAPKRADLPEGETVKNWIFKQKDAFLDSHDLGARIPKQGWVNFGFPLHYNADILEEMYALALLETQMTPQLKRPLEIIRDKMTPDGKWVMENSLNGKMWADVEEKGKPSKWITFFALYVQGHFNMEQS